MCEIIAVSANTSVPVTFSWQGFRERGRINRDGWGFAYAVDGVFKVEKRLTGLGSDPKGEEATDQVITDHFLGHVRYRVQGAIALENTQPFLDGVGHQAIAATMSRCNVTSRFKQEVDDIIVGATGPEILFALFRRAGDVRDVIERVFLRDELKQNAAASFVLSDAQTQYVFGFNKPLFRVTRRPPHTADVRLRNTRDEAFEAGVGLEKGSEEIATVVASTPLTNEEWVPVQHRELVTVKEGEVQEAVRL